jgi:hypothetical protein
MKARRAAEGPHRLPYVRLEVHLKALTVALLPLLLLLMRPDGAKASGEPLSSKPMQFATSH